jgi:Type II CAAX prenyl endopeptidase Rce1-like
MVRLSILPYLAWPAYDRHGIVGATIAGWIGSSKFTDRFDLIGYTRGMTTFVQVRKTMLEALLALVLNAMLGGILFATQQTWLLPSQANTSAIFELAGGDPQAVKDLKLEGLGAKPIDKSDMDPQADPGSKEVAKDQKKSTDASSESPLLDVLASSPWLALLGIAVFFPLGEELIFRGLPMLVLWLSARKISSLERANLPFAWLLGIAAATVFSLAHGIGSSGFHLPLPQLVLGVWLWWIATRRGLGFSILAHGTYNFLPGVLAVFATGLLKP